ncbi:hypothetical protein PR202_gb20830 [Eleusine coracana subsp. coracana]|uniref:Uncharacterized protein n=1 Tax=Eleusine coracana subsp. coracana TaxID=191504 RepID=A0AAV5FBP2_ELECO|nr:hypothetical protein PR202_gb20830 [Eleusine coracana subsp. coracana]
MSGRSTQRNAYPEATRPARNWSRVENTARLPRLTYATDRSARASSHAAVPPSWAHSDVFCFCLCSSSARRRGPFQGGQARWREICHA